MCREGKASNLTVLPCPAGPFVNVNSVSTLADVRLGKVASQPCGAVVFSVFRFLSGGVFRFDRSVVADSCLNKKFG